MTSFEILTAVTIGGLEACWIDKFFNTFSAIYYLTLNTAVC